MNWRDRDYDDDDDIPRSRNGRLVQIEDFTISEEKSPSTQFSSVTSLSQEQGAACAAIKDWLAECGKRTLAGAALQQPLFALGGYAGTGKALAFDQEVQTPSGPVPIGKLRVGDLVWGLNGTATRVIGVFPQGVRQAYRVTLRDGSSVECDIEHLWTVQKHKARSTSGEYSTLSLRDIVASGLRFPSGPHKFCVPLCQPLQYPPDGGLPIDPYALGAFIGDGTNFDGTPTLTTPDIDKEIIAFIAVTLPAGIEVVEDRTSNCPRYRLADRTQRGNRITTAFRGLGLAGLKSPERFIPERYKRASVDQRWALLRGLMDTDGTSIRNRTSFSTMSPRLASDIVELVQSLGGTAIRRDSRPRDGEIQINIKTFECPFRLRRKALGWKRSHKNPPSRFIVDVHPTRECEHVCIKVEAADGLFVTKDHIVTHNTTLLGFLAADVSRTLSVAFCTLTGKASGILSRSLAANGAHPAYCGTIHRLMYAPVVDETNGAVLGWDKQPVLDYDLIVVDEASMLSGNILEDMLSYRIPILAVGDHGQLPPVGEDVGVMAHPDARLETVHRQALGNPIIELSVIIRQGGAWKDFVKRSVEKRVQYLDPFDVNAVIMDRFKAFQGRPLAEDPLIICGMNRTRASLNAVARHSLQTEEKLVVGDRLICLKNAYFSDQSMLANGTRGIVTKTGGYNPNPLQLKATVEFQDEGTRLEDGLMCKLQLGRDATIKTFLDVSPHIRSWKEVGLLMDYGYALTCHKAQGSQASDVIVVVERFQGSLDEWLRWLYTATTRASDTLTMSF